MELKEALTILEAPKFEGKINSYIKKVKSNFKKLILINHPDKKGGDQEKARLILLAFTAFKVATNNGELVKLLSVVQYEKVEDLTWELDWGAASYYTELLVKGAGSLPNLLKLLPRGVHWLVCRGIRFQVEVSIDGANKMYRILHESLSSLYSKEISGNIVSYLLGVKY